MSNKAVAIFAAVTALVIFVLIARFGGGSDQETSEAAASVPAASSTTTVPSIGASGHQPRSRGEEFTTTDAPNETQPVVTAHDGTPLDVPLPTEPSEATPATDSPASASTTEATTADTPSNATPTTAGPPSSTAGQLPPTTALATVEVIMLPSPVEQAEMFAQEYWTRIQDESDQAWRDRVGRYASDRVRATLFPDPKPSNVSVSAQVGESNEVNGEISDTWAKFTVYSNITEYVNGTPTETLSLPMYVYVQLQDGGWLVTGFSFYSF